MVKLENNVQQMAKVTNKMYKYSTMKVFFMNEQLLAANVNIEIIPLRNPQSGQKSRYIINNDDHLKMFEILQFNQPMRSWFIDDFISSNGCIYLTTPIDPLFMILPYLHEKCTKLYMPIEQFLIDDEFTQISILANLISKDQLLLVADSKKNGDLQAFKYNETKTLHWLHFKLKKLSQKLGNDNVHINSATQCASFVKSDKLQDDKNDDELIRYSFGILSEYISSDLNKKLQAHIRLEDVKSIKRKSTTQLDGVTNTKRVCSDINTIESGDKVKVKPIEKKISAKEKARARAATGAKSITSFFKTK